MLNVSHLTVSRNKRVVLNDVSLVVSTGSISAVLGPSGSGKTTLLRSIAGLIRIDAGMIMVDDRDITHLPTHQRGVGLMFQDGQLFPTMNVHDNIAFGLRMQKKSKQHQRERVDELLSLIHLPDYGARDVSTLSGGESRRVALARAIAPSPPVLLLDEPLTGLEEDLRHELARDIAHILRATNTTAIVVTHDRREADIMANTVMELSPRGNGNHGGVLK